MLRSDDKHTHTHKTNASAAACVCVLLSQGHYARLHLSVAFSGRFGGRTQIDTGVRACAQGAGAVRKRARAHRRRTELPPNDKTVRHRHTTINCEHARERACFERPKGDHSPGWAGMCVCLWHTIRLYRQTRGVVPGGRRRRRRRRPVCTVVWLPFHCCCCCCRCLVVCESVYVLCVAIVWSPAHRA